MTYGHAFRDGYFPIGDRAHIVQVGLGDNRTFLHELTGGKTKADVRWLLSACSSRKDFLGVAVEPVWKHFQAARNLAWRTDASVALVQAALGAEDGQCRIFYVDEPEPRDLARLSPRARENFEWQMSYLRNMSSAEEISPHLAHFHGRLQGSLGVAVPLVENWVPIITWTQLAAQVGFKGCEVLILDTEGFDVEILRSMMQHCERRPQELPWLIQFESNGLCNARAGYDCETEIMEELERVHYVCVGKGRDSYCVLKDALPKSWALQKWLESWCCAECNARDCFPYVITPEVLCQRCSKRSRWW
ncbi:unnamed protein product [Effrenium voratum]|nr:unnamed protein product [Effrenium voratum]